MTNDRELRAQAIRELMEIRRAIGETADTPLRAYLVRLVEWLHTYCTD